MKFHPELGPTPTVGVELEVARWSSRSHNVATVSKQLEEEGLMPPGTFSLGRHDYHCDCTVCRNIGTMTSFPVLFKCQRDASLPQNGGEFISSPFPLDKVFLDQATAAYNIIGSHAERPSNGERNQRDTAPTEVGLHVHSYSSGPNLIGMSGGDNGNLATFAHTAFLGFVPELFAVARANNENLSRSLTYRMVELRENADLGGHHSFVTAASTRRRDGNVEPHVEWRLWEIPYTDETYFRGVIVISAALTQILHRRALLEKLSHLNALTPWLPDRFAQRSSSELMEIIDNSFSPRRFELLRSLILEGTGVGSESDLRGDAERILERVG